MVQTNEKKVQRSGMRRRGGELDELSKSALILSEWELYSLKRKILAKEMWN